MAQTVDSASIEEVVREIGKIARSCTLKIAAAESLTAGRVQTFLGMHSGSSEFFAGGITAYSLQSKVSCLGVDYDHAEGVNCVSERVASEMAVGGGAIFCADVVLATTGYAERDH